MEKLILIKYGELTTKKNNRNMFINLLEKNIKNILKNYPIKIIKDRVRMFIEVDNLYIPEISQKLQTIFGIHSIVIANKTNNNIDDIKATILAILKNENFKTFKVQTKRANKNFAISSMEFSKEMGGLVLANFNCQVDVHHPDLLIKIEIRQNTYISTAEIPCLGGYPVGVQGKGLLMLSGGIDSPVAGYLALKRGVDLECLYFESPPHTSLEAKNKVISLAQKINAYSGNIKLHILPFTKLQEEIYKNIPENYMITILRRMMYRIAERLVRKNKLKVIINGESIGQVASQTLSSMIVINEVTTLPVIRPVATLDKIEIISIAQKIATYETSILPYEDCCTIFSPKHPIINPTLAKCLEYEQKINFDKLIDECLENIETINLTVENNYQNLL
ncbi:MAG: tRNA uracil 4-sulfurtransferase ThiI [Bacilli bacterium]